MLAVPLVRSVIYHTLAYLKSSEDTVKIYNLQIVKSSCTPPSEPGMGSGNLRCCELLLGCVDPTGHAVKRHNVGQQMYPQLSHSYQVAFEKQIMPGHFHILL